MLKHITSREQFLDAIKEGTVIVDFYATWCGPCKMLTPVLEQLSEENPDVTILKVDVDEVSSLSAQFGIQAVPTLLLFKGGQQIDMRLGYQNKNQLLNFINQ
jgi:thioredoxin 1